MIHRKKPCDVCSGTLIKFKTYVTENHNLIYEERCAHCKNLLYGEVKKLDLNEVELC